MSNFWSVYVTVLTLASIIGCAVLLKLQSIKRTKGKTAQVTGHVWDGDLEEYNNPLPRWWMILFYLTIFFGLAYLVFYPGLGNYPGANAWTSHKQYAEEMTQAHQQYDPLFEKYLKTDIKTLAADPKAKQMGERLFLTYCAQCHGSDAGGGKGFPNLRDHDWLYGGAPETIEASITQGRQGAMPTFGAAFGPEKVKDVAHYVLSLSARKHDVSRAMRGKETFNTICMACHGVEGKGNPVMGAPNLTDQTWLYGGSEQTIIETITHGRNGKMPSHQDFLGEAKIHLLAGYVYGLSNEHMK